MGGDPLNGSQFDIGLSEFYQIMFDYDGDGAMNEAIKFGDENQLFWEVQVIQLDLFITIQAAY